MQAQVIKFGTSLILICSLVDRFQKQIVEFEAGAVNVGR